MIEIKKQFVIIVIFLFMIQWFSFGQGSTYSGSYTNSAPIIWNGINNQTISKLAITNSSGHCISLTNCSNITIQYCKLGPSKNEGVYIYNCKNITVINCSMDSIDSGVFAVKSTGIKVNYNDVKNVLGPIPRGQMAQFAEIYGGGNSISYNVGENIPGQSFPEDEISLFMSNGIPGDPIRIVGNWIRGGGPSNSGGGIMTGDEGGSNILVQNNILVDPGQYGITIASGNNISIKNNKIYAKQQPFSNIGLSAYKQYEIDCSSDTIMNNEVNFTYKDGQLNNLLNNGGCGDVFGWNTNIYNSKLNSTILPVKIIGRAAQVDTIVSPPKPITAQTLKIYPNPDYAHGLIITSPVPNTENVVIYDLKGQILLNQSINKSITNIDTSVLSIGVYIVKILNNNKIVDVRKIIVGKK
jgi:hypothetical protein